MSQDFGILFTHTLNSQNPKETMLSFYADDPCSECQNLYDENEPDVACCKNNHILCEDCGNRLVEKWKKSLEKKGMDEATIEKIMGNGDDTRVLPSKFCTTCCKEYDEKIYDEALDFCKKSCQDLIDAHPKFKQYQDILDLREYYLRHHKSEKKRFREIIEQDFEGSLLYTSTDDWKPLKKVKREKKKKEKKQKKQKKETIVQDTPVEKVAEESVTEPK